MDNINDELKNLLLEQFFGMGKEKPKGLMKITVENVGYGAVVGVTIQDEFRNIITEEEKEKLGKALKPLFDAMDQIIKDNKDLKAWIKSEKPENEHDCENCPEDIKKECKDIKKSFKEELSKAVEAANKSQGVN